ncbi:Ras-related protein Rab-20 [Myotis davidii]|uniref:Ras-related protein Rab-20 n=1 Tax=Myotis davidii TaxID=225400 RepID=L5LFF9_MYODS|nr:Ras-related protein Rab-20 [Myotis davidii]
MRKPDGKIVLLGDMNVGKTSLLQRYMERRFADTVSTVGGAFYLKQWRSYHISIWDTAGEELVFWVMQSWCLEKDEYNCPYL